MYQNLHEFIGALDQAGELRRIACRVSPLLEISEIADRESKSAAPNPPSAGVRRTDPRFHRLGGHALLFENVEGSDFPVLINSMGSYRRMEMALGCSSFEAIAARLASLTKPEPPRSMGDLFERAGQFLPLLRIPPKRRSGLGACQEVVKSGAEVDLTRLPLIRCWPLDGDFESMGYPAGVNDGIPGVETGEDWNRQFRGRYITLAGIHTIHADDRESDRPSSHNIGMYRIQLLGRRHMAMHWHMHHDGARHWRSWKAIGKRMPVAIVLGGESVLPYAATAPLPPGMSELLLAGFLNGKGIPMVRGVTVPLWVPANAEFVIEGWVSQEAGMPGWDPQEMLERGLESDSHGRDRGLESPRPGRRSSPGPGAVFEGPFGDHTGFYSMPDRYPLLEVTAITHRRKAVYPTTIVGLPPQEDYAMGKATERIFLPLLRTIVPDIEDYDLPMFGAFHNCAFVKIRKQYPMHARRVMHAIWGAGQMSWTKTIVVVDVDVDVHDATAVLRAVGEHCVPARDSELVHGPLDILDHAAPFLGAGGKLGLDATRKWPGAEEHRVLEGKAAELCAAGPIGPALGAEARATEARVRRVPGVLGARVPEELGGWWLLIRAAKGEDGAGQIKAIGALAEEILLPRWTIVVGEDVDLANLDDALFHWMAGSSPDRDRYLSVCGRRVAFDGTPKAEGADRRGLPVRAWPPLIRMDQSTKDLVTRRWSEYFGTAGQQPDSNRARK